MTLAGIAVLRTAGTAAGLVTVPAAAASLRAMEIAAELGILSFGAWVAFNLFATLHLEKQPNPALQYLGRTWSSVFFLSSPYQALLATWAILKVSVVVGDGMYHLPFDNSPVFEDARNRMLVQVAEITALSGLLYGAFGLYVLFGADRWFVRGLGLVYCGMLAAAILTMALRPEVIEALVDRSSVRVFYWSAHGLWLLAGAIAWQLYYMSAGLSGPRRPAPGSGAQPGIH